MVYFITFLKSLGEALKIIYPEEKMKQHLFKKRFWFKVISLLLVQAFLFTNISVAGAGTFRSADNSYLAPTINIENGAIVSVFNNNINNDRGSLRDRVTQVGPADTGLQTKKRYYQELNRLESEGYIQAMSETDRQQLLFAASDAQLQDYLEAIKNELELRGEKTITPDILFDAADRALKDKKSEIKARIGLQPGTINPLTYGHITASLAGILGRITSTDKNKNTKVMTLIANGGTVPDKPFASPASIRNEMAREACKDPELGKWADVTPIRGQMVDMFSSSADTLAIAGKDEGSRRFNMDMAAFIWLFVANPNVEWIYQVGSDKVDGYGRKNERGLLEETLSREEAHATVVYFTRTGEEIDYEKNIKAYPWLDALWNKGFFIESTVGSFANLSATDVRTALVEGKDYLGDKASNRPLNESVSKEVIDYIRNTPQGDQLRFLYSVEIRQKKAMSDIKKGNIREGMDVFADLVDKTQDRLNPAIERLDNITKEIERLEAELEQADTDKDSLQEELVTKESMRDEDIALIDTLRRVRLLLLANQIRALTDVGALNEVSQVFLIYSAAPGTGKGELMDATFEKGKGRFSDIIGKLILYHTRDPRVKKGASEKDGIKYHFRTEEDLLKLYDEGRGPVTVAWINRQLQGLAKDDFVEKGLAIADINGANNLQPNDIIEKTKKDKAGKITSLTVNRQGQQITLDNVTIPLQSKYDLVEGDVVNSVISDSEITVDRQIKGFASIFREEKTKPIILEGGYDWFNALIAENDQIVSMFLAPFSNDQINTRAQNTQWINQTFRTAKDRLTAYRTVQDLIIKNQGEVDLNDAQKGADWQKAIRDAVSSERDAQFNGDLIESADFIDDLNQLLDLYGKPLIETGEIEQIRSMAHEITRRIASRDGEVRFSRGKRPQFEEGESDPQNDRYNRVLEGIVQIRHRYEYEQGRQYGKIVPNPWAYTKEQMEQVVADLVNDFTSFYFESILKGIRSSLATKGHPKNAPPAVDALLRRISTLSDADIAAMDLGKVDPDTKQFVDGELDGLIRELVNTGALKYVQDLQQVFLIYSAAPGTGKGLLMDNTFDLKAETARYKDLIGKVTLYHTRQARVNKGEKDGIKYHFRTEKQLRELKDKYPDRIELAWVNRQLQGLAVKDLDEAGVAVNNVSGADKLQAGDKLTDVIYDQNGMIAELVVEREQQEITLTDVQTSADTMYEFVTGDTITAVEGNNVEVTRPIKGLATVFTEGKPVILEGGYDWFNKLSKSETTKEIVTMFLSPFSDEDLIRRAKNTAWINDMFGTPEERLSAYRTAQKLIEQQAGEIDLTIGTDIESQALEQDITEQIWDRLNQNERNAFIQINGDDLAKAKQDAFNQIIFNSPSNPDKKDMFRAYKKGIDYSRTRSLVEMELDGQENIRRIGNIVQSYRWRQAVVNGVEEDKIALANAELIESNAFIQDVNALLKLFNKEALTADQYDLVRALAYEVNRRIVSREGQKRFSRGKRPDAGAVDAQHDRYNRVLEGVVQIIKRHDYDQDRPNSLYGKIVDNPWGYTEEAKKAIINNLVDDFTLFFFENIITQVRNKINSVPVIELDAEAVLQLEGESMVGKAI
jgi:guanylate kinase